MSWVNALEVEPWRQPRPPLTPAQRRGFFGHLRYGYWIIRYLEFTEPEGEAEVIAEIARYGSIESQTFQHATVDEREEWGAIGDVSSRVEDRRQGKSPRHLDYDPHFLKKEKAAKQFWREAAGTAGPPPDWRVKAIKCVNCGEPAQCIFRAAPYCLECMLEEKAESE